MLIKQELDCSRWEGGSRTQFCSGVLLAGQPRQGTLASCLTLLSPPASRLGRSLGGSISLDFV